MSKKDGNTAAWWDQSAAESAPRVPGVLSWRFVAILALIASLLIAVFQFFAPEYADLILASALFPASFAMLALVLYTRPFARYAEVRLLGVFALWALVVLFLNNWRVEKAFTSTWFYSFCVTMFLCFPFAYAFSKEGAAKALSVLASALLAGVTLYALAGLLVVSNLLAPPLRLTQAGCFGLGADGRLCLLCHPNTFGSFSGGAIVLAGYLFARSKKWLSRAVLLVCAAVCFTALALTDSRTAILATALGFAFEVFLGAALLFSKRKAALRVAVALVAGLAALVLFAKGASLVRTNFPALSAPQQASVISEPPAAETPETSATEAPASEASVTEAPATEAPATEASVPDAPAAQTPAAETPDPAAADAPELTTRGLSDFDSFNGRTAIWMGTLQGLKANPSVLLTGTSPIISGSFMEPYFPPEAPQGNFHNSYLAWLVAYGVPGVLLLAAFLVLLAVASVKLSFGTLFERSSLAVRLVPALLLFSLTEGLMEVFLFVEFSLNLPWIFLLLCGGFVFRMTKRQ